MGRYANYMKDIWDIQANRKVVGVSLFGVIFDNSIPFTPGDQLQIADGAEAAIKLLAQKGYDLLVISGQPAHRTRNLEVQDFENILAATRDGVERLGGRIKNAYYAPGVDKNDPYVKPNAGMFERAQNEKMVKWSETVFVGADVTDVKAATKVKATPVLIKSKNNEVKTKAFELTHQIKVQEFSSLLDFVNTI
jgi:HAD superfamily hydrolase (TIGR01662 family)